MQINVANQRILLFFPQITAKEAEEKAWEKKIQSFDAISKFGSFLSRPSDEDFKLLYQEHRYQPFWHVVAKSRYVYERNSQYQAQSRGPEVKTVSYQKTDYEVINGHIHFPVLEHCIQEEQEEVLVDGVTGKNLPQLKIYLALSPKHITGDLEKEVEKNAILVPPQSRVSAIMRDALAKMIKGIQADKVIEESVQVEYFDRYYRPVYAFKYCWQSKNKEAIVEVDGLTGEISTGNRIFKEYLGKVLDQNFLFDLGADAAGMLIPGGSIAVKIAKKYIDTKKK
jgi:hypothetical protein